MTRSLPGAYEIRYGMQTQLIRLSVVQVVQQGTVTVL